MDFIHPDYKEVIAERIKRRLAGEEIKLLGEEVRGIRKDGSHIYAEYSASRITYEGKPAILIVFRDITSRKQIEQSLRESEERYRSLVELSPDGVLVYGEGGVIQFMNQSGMEILNASNQEDVVGKPVFNFIHPDDRKATIKRAEQVLAGGTGTSLIEIRGLPLGGGYIYVEYASRRLNYEGAPTVQVVFRDITERRLAQEEIKELTQTLERRVAERTAQLEIANKELEAFTYSVSHDLRAPLRSIDGFSQALLEDYENKLDQTGQDYLYRVRASAQRMAKLIDDMLRLSRVTRAEILCESVNLSTIAEDILANLKRGESERDVEVDIQPDVMAVGDRNLLSIMMENLLDNAWKFTGKKPVGRIQFGMMSRDNEKVYFVRDNGAGFDMAYANKLFEPFQRLHTEAEFPGTGIGLAIVHRIISRHGGKVWAEGEVDHGATFYFILPDRMEEIK
jgi:PAS domain S-box-containing protein